MPVGQTVAFHLHAPDVIHSFWIPALGGKRDVVPHRVNRIVLTPDAPGEYLGQCAEYCGVSHANMRFRVDRPHEGRLRGSGSGPAGAAGGVRRMPLAQQGKEIFATVGVRGVPHHRGRVRRADRPEPHPLRQPEDASPGA